MNASAPIFDLSLAEGELFSLTHEDSFAAGYLRHGIHHELHAVYRGQQMFAVLRQQANENKRRIHRVHALTASLFEQAGTFVTGLSQVAVTHRPWLRPLGHGSNFSMVFMGGQLSAEGVRVTVRAFAAAPLGEWDALVVPTRAALANLDEQYEIHFRDLQARVGATRQPRPHLINLPLGITTELYRRIRSNRGSARVALGIESDEVVIVTSLEEITEAADFHLLALALRQLNSNLIRRVRLVAIAESGAPRSKIDGFEEFFAKHTPSLLPAIVIGPDAATPRFVHLALGDIWLALARPRMAEILVAMASGLPVVSGDWDSSRDIVRDGETGFLIPVELSPIGASSEIDSVYALPVLVPSAYDRYLRRHAAIDLSILVKRLMLLIEQPDVRMRFGEAAAARARTDHDWSVVIPQHDALWSQLAARRPKPDMPEAWLDGIRPNDPSAIGHLTGRSIMPRDAILRGPGEAIDEAIAEIRRMIAPDTLVNSFDHEHCEAMLSNLFTMFDEWTLSQLLEFIPASHQFGAMRTLSRFIRYGIVRRIDPDCDRPPAPGGTLPEQSGESSRDQAG